MISPSRQPATNADGNGATTAGKKHCGRRGLKALVVVSFVAALLVAAGLMLLRSPSIPVLTDSALEAAEKLWEREGPASYDMEIEIRGVQAGKVLIEVRNKEVTAMQRDGITPKQRRTWDVWSVPGMFEMIERELQLAADPEHEMQAASGTKLRLLCEFDRQYGYPRQFQRIVYGGGPDVYWRVVKFEPK